jgi:hypothetical protein
MAEPTGPETATPTASTEPGVPRDARHWAAKVDRLQVEAREGVRGTNVAGKRVTGPVQGFGKLWQKIYSVDVGAGISPQDAIAVWKAHFPEFWPQGNRFAGALTGISPGDVALLDIAVGGGVKMSTGVFVLYADAESFTFATPQGHQFAGWITFSAERVGEATVVQTQVLLRAVIAAPMEHWCRYEPGDAGAFTPRPDCGTRRRQRSARRSARICRTTLRPGMPVTPPPPWVADPAWYSPRTGVRRSA